MAKIRGFAVVLILFGLVAGIAPFCGYQNRLISSISNDLNIYYVICLLAIISGIAILYFPRRSHSARKFSNYGKKYLHDRNSKAIKKTTQTLNCPFCSYELDRLVTYCPRCLNNISDTSRNTFCFNYSDSEYELRSIIKKWMSHPSFSVIDGLIIQDKYDLSDSLVKMIDNDKPDGLSLIREDEKLNKLCREVSTKIINSGFFIGIEFAEKNKLADPITNIGSIPKEARELLVVAFQDINNLLETLMSNTWPLLRSDFNHFEKIAGNIHRHIYSQFIVIYNKGIEIYNQKIKKLDSLADKSTLSLPSEDAPKPKNTELGETNVISQGSYRNNNNKCPCCGNNIREGDQYCRKCGSLLNINTNTENEVEKIENDITCPFCGKTVEKKVSICPYCLRNIPRQDYDFGFDYQERQSAIVNIVSKWTSEPLFESTSNQLIALTLPLRELAFKLIDEGHPPGQETIKRNLDLGKLCAEEMGPFALSAYCIGLEYGRTKEQVTPILDVSSVPQKVKDMAIVLVNRVNPLFSRLVDDINNVRKLDECTRQKYIEECTTMGFGVFFACYNLGVATTASEI